MWIFTPMGFFSVVWCDPKKVTGLPDEGTEQHSPGGLDRRAALVQRGPDAPPASRRHADATVLVEGVRGAHGCMLAPSST